MTAKQKSLDPNIMSQFTGSEHWYRFGIVPDITCTDGAKYVADTAGAYWLLDEIAIAQKYVKQVAAEEFQVWKLTVKPDSTAILACEDGNDNVVFSNSENLFPQEITSSGSLVFVTYGNVEQGILVEAGTSTEGRVYMCDGLGCRSLISLPRAAYAIAADSNNI